MADTEDRMDTEGLEDVKKDIESGRPGRRTSKVWQVFNRLDENNAHCTLCNRTLSFKSSVTNLSKHIQRKHGSAYAAMCATDEDPREGLKEFITIEPGPDHSNDLDEGEEDHLRSDDTDWVPPSKSTRKSMTQSKKVIKKEVISSNGVDYVIYTHDQPVSRPTPSPAPKRSTTTTPLRSINASRTSGLSQISTPRPAAPTTEDDEFATFAKFLSQRIRALKNPYWQSCAINEINSALHRIEMRRYEVPKIDCAQSFAQTDPLVVQGGPHTIVADPAINSPNHNHVVEVITQDDVL